MGIFVLFAVFCVIQLHGTAADSSFIKREMGSLAVTGVAAVALFLPSELAVPKDFRENVVNLPALVVTIATVSIVCITLVLPLSKFTFEEQRDSLDEAEDPITMTECLADTTGRETFRSFLASEFSVENILCLDEIDGWEDMLALQRNRR